MEKLKKLVLLNYTTMKAHDLRRITNNVWWSTEFNVSRFCKIMKQNYKFYDNKELEFIRTMCKWKANEQMTFVFEVVDDVIREVRDSRTYDNETLSRVLQQVWIKITPEEIETYDR